MEIESAIEKAHLLFEELARHYQGVLHKLGREEALQKKEVEASSPEGFWDILGWCAYLIMKFILWKHSRRIKSRKNILEMCNKGIESARQGNVKETIQAVNFFIFYYQWEIDRFEDSIYGLNNEDRHIKEGLSEFQSLKKELKKQLKDELS